MLKSAAFVFVLSLCLAGSLHANPAPTTNDDLDSLLAEKGLLGQLNQVRQSVAHKASELVFTAMGFMGMPYKRGGSSAETGFDCSGFVHAMYAQTLGLLLPRRAEQQAAATQTIDKAELQPGDLVFFNTLRRTFSHVGIYVGDGKFVHSPKPGAQVRVEDMGVGYWRNRFDGARRVALLVPAPGSAASNGPALCTSNANAAGFDAAPGCP
ncbi:MAG: C40 family peptidase [Burkholderiales bacterium]